MCSYLLLFSFFLSHFFKKNPEHDFLMTSSYVDLFTKEKKIHDTLFISKGPKVLETPQGRSSGTRPWRCDCLHPAAEPGSVPHLLPPPAPPPQPAWVWVRPWRPRGKDAVMPWKCIRVYTLYTPQPRGAWESEDGTDECRLRSGKLPGAGLQKLKLIFNQGTEGLGERIDQFFSSRDRDWIKREIFCLH